MIIRIQKRRDRPFAIIDTTALQDPNLSFRSKGVLAYLLSKPDHWEVNMKDLMASSFDGRDAIRSALQELRENGYAKLVPIRKESGGFGGRRLLIFECPQEETESGDLKDPRKKGTSSGTPENPVFRRSKDTPFPLLRRDQGEGRGFFEEEGKENPMDDVEQLVKEFNQWRVANRFLDRMNYASPADRDAFRSLLKSESLPSIRGVMQWYFKNWRDKYVPTCRTAKTFCQDFVRVDKAMRRSGAEVPRVQEEKPSGKSKRVIAQDEIDEVPE